jgi:hypothetical protein
MIEVVDKVNNDNCSIKWFQNLDFRLFFLFLMVLFLKKNTIVLQLLESFCVCVSRGTTDAILLLKWKLIPWGDIKSSFGLLHCEEKYCVWRSSADLYDRFIVRRKCSPCSSGLSATSQLYFLSEQVNYFFLELHSRTHMLTTRTHTHPYEYTYTNPAPMCTSEGLSTGRSGDSQSHHWRLVVDGNVAYHLTHNIGKSEINPGKCVSTRIWTLVPGG